MIQNYPQNRFEKMIENIKKNRDIPVAIKGAGELGQKIFAFLENNGIKVDAFLVDQSYYKNEIRNQYMRPVYEFEEYVAEKDCIILIGYRGYRPEQISIKARKHIRFLYDYDFIGRLVLTDNAYLQITKEFLTENFSRLQWLYEKLEDVKSVESLDDFIHQRIYGNYSKDFEKDQYFQSDIVKLEKEEVFVDCGAFQGESTLGFIEFAKNQGINKWEKIITFEPDPYNMKIMKTNTKEVNGVQYEQAGVYSSTQKLYLDAGNGSSSAISNNGNIEIEVKSIDDVLKGGKATFIKMDIEGSEMEALKGAKKTIVKYKPKLAICIYHKREDIIDIPQYIYKLNPNYKFYIRNHDSSGIECVLYAV